MLRLCIIVVCLGGARCEVGAVSEATTGARTGLTDGEAVLDDATDGAMETIARIHIVVETESTLLTGAMEHHGLWSPSARVVIAWQLHERSDESELCEVMRVPGSNMDWRLDLKDCHECRLGIVLYPLTLPLSLYFLKRGIECV